MTEERGLTREDMDLLDDLESSLSYDDEAKYALSVARAHIEAADAAMRAVVNRWCVKLSEGGRVTLDPSAWDEFQRFRGLLLEEQR